jgi:hypothetical protein
MLKFLIITGIINVVILIALATSEGRNTDDIKKTVTAYVHKHYSDVTNIKFSRTHSERMPETYSSIGGKYAEAEGTFETSSWEKIFCFELKDLFCEWAFQIFDSGIEDSKY